MKHPELYACIYLRDFSCQAMLRLRPSLQHTPCVVLEGEPPLQRVCSTTPNARLCGAAIGMNPSEVETIPQLHTLRRSHVEELSAKAVLLESAWSISPRVEAHSSSDTYMLIIDCTGTETLHGNPHTLAQRLLQQSNALSFQVTIAFSQNYHASICMARAITPPSCISILASGTEAQMLSPLPLSVLDLSEEHSHLLTTWGIHTLGMLAALPARELASRLGQQGPRLQKLSSGTHPHLFCPEEPALKLAESMELDTPVVLLDSLLFVIGSMLEQLVRRATDRILALASIGIHLALEGGITYSRTITPALPTNDRKIWVKLIHLDLELHPPHAPILAIRLGVDTGTLNAIQIGLFSPQTPEPNRLDVTIARIRSIVGEHAVGSPLLADTHKMDSFHMQPFSVKAARDRQPHASAPKTCVRQVRPPEPARVRLQNNRPDSFSFRDIRYRVEAAYGPWAANGEWWHAGQWSYEQWDILASSQDGSRLACCLAHSPSLAAWHVVSLYD